MELWAFVCYLLVETETIGYVLEPYKCNDRNYVPKSKCSMTRKLCEQACMYFKSWIKPQLLATETIILKATRTKSRRTRQSYFTAIRKRPCQKTTRGCMLRHQRRPRYMQTKLHHQGSAYQSGRQSRNEVSFDTDSRPMRVDNCASRTMLPFIEDFD